MKSVVAIVLLEIVGYVVKREGAVANSVHVTPGDGIVDGMAGIDSWEGSVSEGPGRLGSGGGGTVVCGIVVAKNDITLDSVLVLDEEVC